MRKPETSDGALPPAGVVDDELRSFFSVHDGKWGSPFYAELEAILHPELPDTDGYAVRVYWQIRKRLGRLSDHDAGVLMAAYAPRSWPARLRLELGRLTGVVVRLASAGAGWPEGRPAQDLLEVRTARQLDVALATSGRDMLAAYRMSARALLGRALAAYRAVRDGEPAVPWRLS